MCFKYFHIRVLVISFIHEIEVKEKSVLLPITASKKIEKYFSKKLNYKLILYIVNARWHFYNYLESHFSFFFSGIRTLLPEVK